MKKKCNICQKKLTQDKFPFRTGYKNKKVRDSLCRVCYNTKQRVRYNKPSSRITRNIYNDKGFKGWTLGIERDLQTKEYLLNFTKANNSWETRFIALSDRTTFRNKILSNSNTSNNSMTFSKFKKLVIKNMKARNIKNFTNLNIMTEMFYFAITGAETSIFHERSKSKWDRKIISMSKSTMYSLISKGLNNAEN